MSSFATAVGLAAVAVDKGEMPPVPEEVECEFDIRLVEDKKVKKEIKSAMAVNFDSTHSGVAVLLRRI